VIDETSMDDKQTCLTPLPTRNAHVSSLERQNAEASSSFDRQNAEASSSFDGPVKARREVTAVSWLRPVPHRPLSQCAHSNSGITLDGSRPGPTNFAYRTNKNSGPEQITWYRTDMSREHANMFNSRVIGIECLWSGPQRECLYFYRQGILEQAGTNGEKSLVGQPFGSVPHVSYLLGIGVGKNDNLKRIINALGEKVTEQFFDVLSEVRKSWPTISKRMQRIDNMPTN